MIRPAVAGDLSVVEGLLRDAGLPTAGVAEHFASFVVVEEDAEIIAAAGLERYGEIALLRSVVVRPRARGQGLGRAVSQHLVDETSRQGVTALYLLTTTAEGFFPRLGFEPIERASLPFALGASEELRDACPASARALVRSLRL